jgi:multiple sugar transport system substrate-binding protein
MRRKYPFSTIIILWLILACITNTGCRTATQSERELSVVFIQSWGDDVNPFFKKLAQEWGVKNKVRVRVEIVPINDLVLKSTTWIQSPAGDLALLPTNLAMVNTSSLDDVTNLVSNMATTVGGFYEIGDTMAKRDGRYYNVPFCAWPHVWFYRTDLLKKAGRGIPSTFKEAAQTAKLLTDKKANVYGLGIGLGKDEDISMFLQSLIWAYGGSIVDSSGKKVVADSPQVLAAIKYLLDLYKAGVIPPGALGWDNATNNNLFLGKQIAITANTLSIDYVAKRRDPALFAMIEHSEYPAGPAGRFSYTQTFGWSIKKQSSNRDLATHFLIDLYGGEQISRLFALGEGAIAPVMRNIGESQLWKEGRYSDATASVRNAKHLGWPGPFTQNAAEVFNNRILNNIFARIINDHVPADRALSEAAEQIRQIYSH